MSRYFLNTIASWLFFLLALPNHFNTQQVSAQTASSFSLGEALLTDSRWKDNQERTISYLLFVDQDRLLYNFRNTHGLDTQGALANGGWDAPDFPFRSHVQGHFLSAWSQCYAVLKNEQCRDRVTYFVAELAKCQANNEAAGFQAGYLSGFPESEIAKVEDRTLRNGNVPYYCIHKTMAGLLDAWRYVGDETARSVLLEMASWVDTRTSRLSRDQMQAMMQTEYGGMNDIMALLYSEFNDERWLAVATRWDHARVLDPLADARDELDGLHANTQVQKFVGLVPQYLASGTDRYLEIAKNAWDIIVNNHTYAIGGNSQAEHFRGEGEITGFLDHDSCETCNTYNMLKLTRDLWANNPDSSHYFDYYERALLNHLLGVQRPGSEHGHVTYFTSLNPSGHRGVPPAWRGGEGWSTDYNSFWCCQGTSLETYTKLMDSVYWHENDDILYVNLYIPSRLVWADRGIIVRQNTSFPETTSSTLHIQGSGTFSFRVRVPEWTTDDAHVLVNGKPQDDVVLLPGSYATVSRDWRCGDSLTLDFPMTIHTIPANDNPNIAAIAYGPTILAANYGDAEFTTVPEIDIDSVRRVGTSGLQFEATSGGETVNLEAFYNSHEYNYNVYWQL